MSERHVSTVWSGMEGFTWRDKAVEFEIPVSCKSFDMIKINEDFLRSAWMKGKVPRSVNRNNWEVKVIRKIVREDGELDFDCY